MFAAFLLVCLGGTSALFESIMILARSRTVSHRKQSAECSVYHLEQIIHLSPATHFLFPTLDPTFLSILLLSLSPSLPFLTSSSPYCHQLLPFQHTETQGSTHSFASSSRQDQLDDLRSVLVHKMSALHRVGRKEG